MVKKTAGYSLVSILGRYVHKYSLYFEKIYLSVDVIILYKYSYKRTLHTHALSRFQKRVKWQILRSE